MTTANFNEFESLSANGFESWPGQDKGVPSPDVTDWVLNVHEPAVRVLFGVFTEAGCSGLLAEHNARRCLALLMNLDPPLAVDYLK